MKTQHQSSIVYRGNTHYIVNMRANWYTRKLSGGFYSNYTTIPDFFGDLEVVLGVAGLTEYINKLCVVSYDYQLEVLLTAPVPRNTIIVSC